MQKNLLLVAVPMACLSISAAPDDALYTSLLADHVKAGAVDYVSLKDDPRLDRYLGQIAATEPASLPSDKARIALWTNAYNAYTLRLVADHLPLKSIRDLGKGGRYLSFVFKTTPWDRRFAEVGGEVYTLNEIEHDILRGRHHEPRIHFALVCAAASCPPLRQEAYVAGRLDEQFRDQARIFLLDPAKNRYDPDTNTYHLSKIFDWFAGDFGDDRRDLIRFIEQFVRRDERTDGSKAPDGTPAVRFLAYDWSLNGR